MVTGNSAGYNIDVGPSSQHRGSIEKHCWNRRTRTEKCLTCWYLFTALVLLLFVIFYFLHISGIFIFPGLDMSGTKYFKCQTKDCDDRGKIMYDSIDHSTKPCDNFYLHACGKYQGRRRVHSSIQRDQMNSVNGVLKGLLEAPSTVNLSEGAKNARRFYSSCTNVEAIKSKGSKQIVSFFNGEDLQLYTESTWNITDYDVTNDIINLLKYSQGSLFHLTIGVNPDNSSTFIPKVTPCSNNFDLEVIQYQNADGNEDAETNATTVAPISPLNETDSEVSTNATDLTTSEFNETLNNNMTLQEMFQDHLESQLDMKLNIMEQFVRNIYFKGITVADSTINGMREFITKLYQTKPLEKNCSSPTDSSKSLVSKTVSELKTEVPEIDWNRLIEETIGIEPSIEYVLKVNHAEFLSKLNDLLDNSDPRIIHNSLVALFYIDKFHHIATIDDSVDRSKICVEYTKRLFGNEMSEMYIKTNSEAEFTSLKQDVENIEKYIKSPIVDRISGSNWMDKKTINKLQEKVAEIKSTFVAPSFTFYDNEYDATEMSLDFTSNLILRYKYMVNRTHSLYGNEVDPVDITWRYNGNSVHGGSMYSVYFNRLDIPMAYLTHPLYDSNFPSYIKFATIGLAIAHEIAHSITGLGLEFNAEGHPEAMVSPSLQQEVRRHETCFINHYSNMGRNITYQELDNYRTNVDGLATMDENVADQIAIQFAYEGYQDWLLDEVNEEHLRDGHEHLLPQFASRSPNELFFIAAAQVFCSHESTAEYLIATYLGTHTTHLERVNGLMMNSPEFSDTFKCSRGSEMNPNRKCSYI